MHAVDPSSGTTDRPRISISFNVFTMREGDSDWHELSDTSVVVESLATEDLEEAYHDRGADSETSG